jgi:hypothetical protein
LREPRENFLCWFKLYELRNQLFAARYYVCVGNIAHRVPPHGARGLSGRLESVNEYCVKLVRRRDLRYRL